VLEADSARAIRQQLREKGWMPLEVSPTQDRQRKSSGFQFGKGLSTADLALVTRQLATLIQSGIPVEQALSAIAGQSEHPRTKSMMLAVRGKVLEGYTLAGSLGNSPTPSHTCTAPRWRRVSTRGTWTWS